jgi:hypothetical protein
VVDRDELVGLASDRGEAGRIVDQLVHARLVHTHSDVDQGATVELVHEILTTESPTLRRWLDANHALRGFLHELLQAARTWTARGRPSDLLWRGAAADEAVGHATRHVLVLSAAAREFLAATRSHAARSRRRPCPCRATPWAKDVPAAQQEQARALFEDGNQLFAQQAHGPALDRYRAAGALWDHPMIRFNMAVTEIRLDRVLDAADDLQAALRFGQTPFTPELHQQALDYQALLAGRIGELEVGCAQPGSPCRSTASRGSTARGRAGCACSPASTSSRPTGPASSRSRCTSWSPAAPSRPTASRWSRSTPPRTSSTRGRAGSRGRSPAAAPRSRSAGSGSTSPAATRWMRSTATSRACARPAARPTWRATRCSVASATAPCSRARSRCR